MASVLVQHQVNDFSSWKKEFDTTAALRKSHGELSHQVFQDAADANNVTILLKWDSIPNAQKFVGSPELKSAMEKSGLAGAPSIHFLNED